MQPSAAEQAEIVQVVRDAGCHLFSDEMYRLLEFAEGAAPLPSAVDLYDKALSAAGVNAIQTLDGAWCTLLMIIHIKHTGRRVTDPLLTLPPAAKGDRPQWHVQDVLAPRPAQPGATLPF